MLDAPLNNAILVSRKTRLSSIWHVHVERDADGCRTGTSCVVYFGTIFIMTCRQHRRYPEFDHRACVDF